jgi:hypothetical protein
MTYTERAWQAVPPWGAIESLVAVEDYRGLRLLPRQSVRLPGFEPVRRYMIKIVLSIGAVASYPCDYEAH